MISLTRQNVSNQFITSLKFAGGTLINGNVSFAGSSTYGLSNATDTHMMKNSEYSSANYLSHSQYGIDSQIYMNNSLYMENSDSGVISYTGRSGGNMRQKIYTSSEQFPSSSVATEAYYDYGYYTWDGRAIIYGSNTPGGYATDRTLGTNASSTGNIYGVYDMSDVIGERFMAVQQGEAGDNDAYITTGMSTTYNSGFKGYIKSTYYESIDGVPLVDIPPRKYYNAYGFFDSLRKLCNDEYCYGHNFHEIEYWYLEARPGHFNFSEPWIVKRYYWHNFYFHSDAGAADEAYSFRSALIINS